ncbi:MAG: DUF192 domain-containing protein [Bryobacteraceae bacterium]
MAQQFRIVNARSGAVLAGAVTLAHDSQSRRKGWLGIDAAPPGEAIWLEPCEAVHCFFMRFTIDVLFLDRRLRVVRCRPLLRPWRIAVCLRANSVIELSAGTIDASRTVAGDQIVLEPVA